MKRYKLRDLAFTFAICAAIFMTGRCIAQQTTNIQHNLKLTPGTTMHVTSFYLGRPMLLFIKPGGGEMMRFIHPGGSGSLSLKVVLFGAYDARAPQDVDVYLHSDNLYFTLGSVFPRPAFIYNGFSVNPPFGIWYLQLLEYYLYDRYYTPVSVSYCMLVQFPQRCDTRLPQISFILTEMPTLGPTFVHPLDDRYEEIRRMNRR